MHVHISITRFCNRGLKSSGSVAGLARNQGPLGQTVELVCNVSGHIDHTIQHFTRFQPIVLVQRLICASMMARTDELVPGIIVGIDFGMTCTGQQAKSEKP